MPNWSAETENRNMKTARAELRTATLEWRSTSHQSGRTTDRAVRASINLMAIPYVTLAVVAIMLLRAALAVL